MTGEYKVIWRRQCIDGDIGGMVTAEFAAGRSSAPIAKAMLEAERLLKRDPNSAGESRPEFERILFVLPLAVFFEVHDTARVVYIRRAHLVRRRSR